MKRPTLLLVFILILFISCSKSKEAMTLFEVFEYKTTIPIPSVQIDLLRCSYYDFLFGCQTTEIVATGLTDNYGRCAFMKSQYSRSNEGVKLHKSNYWNAGGNPHVKNYLAPESWIDLHLVRQNVYPLPRLIFRYDINGESGSKRITPFAIPIDTVIKIRAFGNEVNNLNWEIGNQFCIMNNYCVTPVVANGIITKSPDKFQTIAATLTY